MLHLDCMMGGRGDGSVGRWGGERACVWTRMNFPWSSVTLDISGFIPAPKLRSGHVYTCIDVIDAASSGWLEQRCWLSRLSLARVLLLKASRSSQRDSNLFKRDKTDSSSDKEVNFSQEGCFCPNQERASAASEKYWKKRKKNTNSNGWN